MEAPAKLTAAECLAELEELVRDKTVLMVGLTRWQMWLLAVAVQLAMRHPQFTGPSAKLTAETAEILAGIAAPDGPLHELWLAGWAPDPERLISEL